MTLKQIVELLNRQHVDNDFKLSELAAKRSADKSRDGVIVRYQNSSAWKDFTPNRVELYEALPVGWPLADVARRLDCSPGDLEIVAQYSALTGKWRSI